MKKIVDVLMVLTLLAPTFGQSIVFAEENNSEAVTQELQTESEPVQEKIGTAEIKHELVENKPQILWTVLLDKPETKTDGKLQLETALNGLASLKDVKVDDQEIIPKDKLLEFETQTAAKTYTLTFKTEYLQKDSQLALAINYQNKDTGELQVFGDQENYQTNLENLPMPEASESEIAPANEEAEESATESQAKPAKETTAESQEATKETEESSGKTAEAKTVPDNQEQIKALQEKLPAGTTVEFKDGKLIIELPAGVDPEVAKKAYDELKLNLPVEIRVKKADAPTKDNASFNYGVQVFKKDMSYKTGDLATVAKVVSGEIKVIIETGDYANGMKSGKQFRWTGKYYDFNPMLWDTKYSMDPVEFRKGYDAARQAYIDEMTAYLDQIKNVGMKERDQLANSTAYGPNAEDSSSKFWGLIATAAKSGLDLIAGIPGIGDFLQWLGLSATPLDKKLPEVWKYDASKPINTDAGNFADYYDTDVAPKISTLVRDSQKNLINYIGVVLPTVQNILVKRTLQDPRALGGLNGVNDILPDTLGGALALNTALDKVTTAFGFSGAIGSSISNIIYLSIREAVATSLVEHGQMGSTLQIQNVLNDTEPSKAKLLSINESHKEGETTALAHDAFYTFSEYYIKAVKNTAMQDAMSNAADKDDAALVDYIFNNYTTLVTGNADALKVAFSKTGEMNPQAGGTANNYLRLQDSTGEAARTFLLEIYKAEKLSIKQAVTDFVKAPLTDPRTLSKEQKEAVKFINPNKVNAKGDSPDPVVVADYMKIRTWLYVASLPQIKDGMHAADLKSHEQLDGNVAKIAETGTTTLDEAAVTNANNTLLAGTDDDLKNTYQKQLKDMVSSLDIYAISYNAEAAKTNTAFANGGKEFINQGTAQNKDLYALLGLNAIKDNLNNPLDNNYTNVNDQTSSLFETNDPKYMGGQAFRDGFAEKFETDGLKINLNIKKAENSQGDINEVIEENKENPLTDNSPDPLTRYGVIGQKDTTFNIVKVENWEIEDPNNKNHALEKGVMTVAIDPYETGSYVYDGQQKINHQKTVDVTYNKLFTAEVTTLVATGNEITGFSAKGVVTTLNGQVPTVELKNKDGVVIASAKVDDKGNFNVTLPKDKVAVGENITATAKFKNTFGTVTESPAKTAQITDSDYKTVLGFNDALSQKSQTASSYSGNDFSIPIYWQDQDINDRFWLKVVDEAGKTVTTFPAEDPITVTDTTGKIDLEIPKDKLPIGTHQFTIQAFKDNNHEISDVAASTEKLTLTVNVAEGILTYDVSTATGENNNELRWTKRKLSLNGGTFDRDAGNNLKIDVSDNRINKGNGWTLTVSTSGADNSTFDFMWNDQLLKKNVSTPVLTGDNTLSKNYSEKEGIKLHSNKTIPINNYSSRKGNSQTITWTMNNTETAD